MSSISEKILKIMALALEICPPDKEVIKGQPQVSIEYFPECSLILSRIFPNGWEIEEESDFETAHSVYIYCDSDNAEKGLDDLTEKIKALKGNTASGDSKREAVIT